MLRRLCESEALRPGRGERFVIQSRYSTVYGTVRSTDGKKPDFIVLWSWCTPSALVPLAAHSVSTLLTAVCNYGRELTKGMSAVAFIRFESSVTPSTDIIGTVLSAPQLLVVLYSNASAGLGTRNNPLP